MKFNDVINVSMSSLNRNGFEGIGNIVSAYLDLQREPLNMSSQPLIVQIEPTLYCNLECRMCVNPISQRKKRHMSLSEFKKIVDGMPLVKKISLVGAGEPLMNPSLFDMLTYAKSKGILAGFATNGMLLTEETCHKIIGAGVNWVNISIDSADKKRYESIRKGANFGTLIKNIRNFVRLKGNSRSPELSMWFVVMEENLKELTDIIKLAKELGVVMVSAQLAHHWSNDALKKAASGLDSEDFQRELKIELKKAMGYAVKNGISFDYVNVPDKSLNRACKWPWKSCYITAEGFITPCCLQGSDPDILNFGNLLKSDFKDIWNCAAYQGFRKSLKSENPPDICIGCTAYYGKVNI